MTNEEWTKKVESMGNVGAIKAYMERDGGRKVTIPECTPLSSEAKEELGRLAKAELIQLGPPSEE